MWPLCSLQRPSLPGFFPLNLGSNRAGDSGFGLNFLLKAAINGDFILEDKPAWFILYSEAGT